MIIINILLHFRIRIPIHLLSFVLANTLLLLLLCLSFWYAVVYGGYSQLTSEGQNVATRQRLINLSYESLMKKAEDRHKCLLDSIRLFKLCSECDEVEAWVREKEAVLQTKEKGSTKEQLDSLQKKYDVRHEVISNAFSNVHV